MELIHSLLLSFALTLLFEFAVAFLFKVRKKGFLIVFLVNLLTNPLVVYAYHLAVSVFHMPHAFLFQVGLEILVVFTECFVYNLFSKEEDFCLNSPILLGIVANAVSWGFGLILNLFL